MLCLENPQRHFIPRGKRNTNGPPEKRRGGEHNGPEVVVHTIREVQDLESGPGPDRTRKPYQM